MKASLQALAFSCLLGGCLDTTAAVVVSETSDTEVGTTPPTGVTTPTPWDSSPPDVGLGALAYFHVQCALFIVPGDSVFRRVSEEQWDVVSGPDSEMVAEVGAACIVPGRNFMLWHADGHIEIEALGKGALGVAPGGGGPLVWLG